MRLNIYNIHGQPDAVGSKQRPSFSKLKMSVRRASGPCSPLVKIIFPILLRQLLTGAKLGLLVKFMTGLALRSRLRMASSTRRRACSAFADYVGRLRTEFQSCRAVFRCDDAFFGLLSQGSRCIL